MNRILLTCVSLIFATKLFVANALVFFSGFEEKTIKNKFGEGLALHSHQGFIKNMGQIFGYDGKSHPEVKFVFQLGNTQIFLLEKGLAYQFTRINYLEGYEKLGKGLRNPLTIDVQEMQNKISSETYRMDMTLKDANSRAIITTEGSSIDYINYYSHNVFNVHHYEKIIYHDIYPGIDWIIYVHSDWL